MGCFMVRGRFFTFLLGVLFGYRSVWGCERGVFEYISVSSPPKIVFWLPLARQETSGCSPRS